ncbi:uncharacterized protein BO97DRAFT_425129 [Aspergillus homomorphus CBS 101889]|uniref:Tat pathway signal sequence n=1 Tax=Aspergillus homomorphus (strain CBS 101889) TaxID=1450537 RepID=A0A395HVK6_ASPHC|nr:hypothetical protein BO97DRAFT_425129 [Aspergillus homomorphus CBS 101889]RAL11830.1 hypothetical protein BO97DRAFT_425129 [Aspergillus homomorphus CBS 101889]
MSPNKKEYHLLQRNSTDDDDAENENETKPDHLEPPASRISHAPNPRTILLTTLSIAVILLSCSNLFFLIHWLRSTKTPPTRSEGGSYYANLHRTLPLPIEETSAYISDNVSAVAHLWEELSGDPGVVALDSNFIAEKNLPEAISFPWDKSKGVYLLQGYHNLHCLRTLFRYAWTADQGLPQRIAFSHVLHCLDQLRQDVICNADDTPRYAGPQKPGHPPGTGAGQVRMCRDWALMERWARERTACFKHHDEVPGRMIDRFKFCPDGRVLWAVD